MQDTNRDSPLACLAEDLAGLGFIRKDAHTYQLNGLTLGLEGRWIVLRATCATRPADPLQGQLGQPGLWRYVREFGGRRRDAVRRTCELPPLVLESLREGRDRADGSVSPCRAALSWAVATAGGAVPAGWAPPPHDHVKAMLPGVGLTVRQGPLVRQGGLVCRPDRLAVEVPILSPIPPAMSPSRRRCLEAVLADAQDRWRLVRIGIEEGAVGSAARAEIDLTGAPHALIEPLVTTGLAALRWVLTWLLRSVDFLADPQVASRSVECASYFEP